MSAGKRTVVAGLQGLVQLTFDMTGLHDALPFVKEMPQEGKVVRGDFPQQCFSFARLMGQTESEGSYVEGWAELPDLTFMPVWHAWYLTKENSVIDGTKLEKESRLFGIAVPVATFKEYMADKAFVKKFETYGEMPFHRACVETGKEMPWLKEDK